MSEQFRKALCKAMIKSGADFDLMCIVASVGDTVSESEAVELLNAYNDPNGMWEDVKAGVEEDKEDAEMIERLKNDLELIALLKQL